MSKPQETTATPPTGVSMSDEALAQAKGLRARLGKPDDWGLRIAVKGGGCSGQLYDIDFCAAGGREGDRCYEFDGLTLYVDRMSYVFLIGTVVDWESSFIKTGFTLRNPNVTAACGCGESVAF